jgi:hypothetical protein
MAGNLPLVRERSQLNLNVEGSEIPQLFLSLGEWRLVCVELKESFHQRTYFPH